jgi:hypothetical protein
MEGQREIKIALDAGLLEARAGLLEVNRRINRLLYAVLGFGGALLAATLGIVATLAVRLFVS